MLSTNLQIKSTKYFKDELSNVEGLIKVNEAQILQDKSKKFFETKLKNNLFQNKKLTSKKLSFKKKNLFIMMLNLIM